MKEGWFCAVCGEPGVLDTKSFPACSRCGCKARASSPPVVPDSAPLDTGDYGAYSSSRSQISSGQRAADGPPPENATSQDGGPSLV